MADTTRLPLPLVEHWEWQTDAACRGMDTGTFFHPVNERNAARDERIDYRESHLSALLRHPGVPGIRAAGPRTLRSVGRTLRRRTGISARRGIPALPPARQRGDG